MGDHDIGFYINCPSCHNSMFMRYDRAGLEMIKEGQVAYTCTFSVANPELHPGCLDSKEARMYVEEMLKRAIKDYQIEIQGIEMEDKK